MILQNKINIAVIGTGKMGGHHARVYSQLKNVNLVAVCDVDEKTAKEIANRYNCKWYENYTQMFQKERIDAVSIAVPTTLHKKVALDVIKFKKHLLIEKPIAGSTKEAIEIIRAARKNNLKLAIGHIERFNPAVGALKKMIQQGKLGKIISIIARRVGVFPPQIKDTNVIIDLAVHDIDVLNYLLNQTPTEIYTKGKKALNTKRIDSAEIFLSFNGISAFLQVNWITPVKIRTLSVNGSKGYAELNYIEQKLEFYESKYERIAKDFGEVVKFSEAAKKEINIDKKEPLLCELESFVKCIQENKAPEVTGEEGLKALIVAEKAIESLKKKKIISL